MFSKEWLTTQGFKDAVKGGYPDMGSGRYSAKLSDEEWIKFNNYQRAHYNVGFRYYFVPINNYVMILICLILYLYDG
jgi:hypothetical protein